MATRTVTVHDRCTTEGCGRVLHSLREAEAGQCSSCWIKAIPADKKAAMNRLIKSAFDGSTEEQKLDAVAEVLKHLGK